VDGNHNITVWANDTEGNINSTYYNYIVDNTEPTVSITSPTPGEYITTSDVTVTWTGGDNYGIDHYEVCLDSGTWIDVGTSTSHTFTSVADGDHTVSVKAVDVANNTKFDIVLFTVDANPPNVAILSPSDGQWFNIENVTVSWSANDSGSGIDYFEVRCYNSSWDSGWINVGTDTSYMFANLADGQYTAEVRAYDNAGNVGVDSVNFGVDTVSPIVTITNPSDGSTIIGGTVTVEWTGSEGGSGIDHYEIKIDDGSWIDVGTDTNYTFTGLSEGDHTVYVRAFDIAGNFGADSVSFTITSAPPEVEILNPANNSYVAGNVSLVISASDDIAVDTVKLFIDGVLVQNWTGAGTFTYYWYTPNYGDGDHNVTVWVNDSSGNEVSKYYNYTVDNTLPTVQISNPTQNEYLISSDVTVTWIGNDNYGIDHYEICLDSGSWIDVGLNTSHTFTGIGDGKHNVSVLVYDKAGNSNVDLVTFFVDTTPPTVNITSPTDGQWSNIENITIIWTGDDATSGIDYFEIRCYNLSWDSGWINVGTDTSYTFTNLADGQYTAEVRVYDNAGNVGVDSVNFGVDTVSPTVSISSPTDGGYVQSSDVEVQWTGSDNPSGIDHYEVKLDTGSWIDVGTQTQYTFTGVSDGQHTVYVKAVDDAGNIATDSVTFTVDSTPPNVTIISPSDGELLNSQTFNVNWNATDNLGLSSYRILANSTEVASGTLTGTSVSRVDTITVWEDAYYIITVEVTDGAGNVGSDSVGVYVNSEAPVVTITGPFNGTYLSTTTVVIGWNISDAADLDHVEVEIDGSVINVGVVYCYVVGGLSEGMHNCTVYAYDSVGNVGSDSIVFYVDVTAPTVSAAFTTLLENSTSVVVSWSASDNLGIDYYLIRADGGSWIKTTGTSYTFSFSEGEHWVQIRAYDKALLYDQVYVVVIVDTTPPNLDILYPENNSYSTETTITIHYNVLDNNDYWKVKIRIDGGSWILVDSSLSYTVSLTEGTHTIDIMAIDIAKNSVVKTVIYTVDVTPPDITITYPTELSTVTTSDVQVQWSSTATDVSYCEVRLDDGAWINVGTSTTYTFVGVSDGLHVVYVLAVDNAGNKNMECTIFSVETRVVVGIIDPSITPLDKRYTEGKFLHSNGVEKSSNLHGACSKRGYSDRKNVSTSQIVLRPDIHENIHKICIKLEDGGSRIWRPITLVLPPNFRLRAIVYREN